MKCNARYMAQFCNCKATNGRIYYFQAPLGHIRCATVVDSQLVMPEEHIVIVSPNITAF